MTLVMMLYHWSLSVPRHIGDDHHVAGADPELGEQLLHLLGLHPSLDRLAEHLEHAHAVVQLVAPRCEHPQGALGELLPGGDDDDHRRHY